MMRIFLKRLVLVFGGGLAMTILVLFLPSNHPEQRHSSVRKLPEGEGGLEPISPPDTSSASATFKRRKLNRKSPSNEGPVPPKQEAFNIKSPSDYLNLPSASDRRLDPDLLGLEKHLRRWKGDLRKRECTHNETIGEHWKRVHNRPWPKADSWDRFFSQIGSCDMYRSEASPELKDLVRDVATMPIKHVAIMDGGTQVKLMITFENGKQAVMKPMRYGRQTETDPNHFYFTDFERHNAEIAAFHLDNVLGLRRAIPTVGRVVNITSDLKEKAEKALLKTFFVSPAGNLCFVSKCDYYCDTTHAICGSPDLKEGSFQVFLPDEELLPRDRNRSPYRRTYSKRKQLAVWQKDNSYCKWKVKKKPMFAHGRRLMDLIEMEIFDFFLGNQDRHHFEAWSLFGDYPAYPLFLDNGRGFGRPREDDLDILAPLSQCCVIRPTILKTLLGLYRGPTSLSEALHRSMSEDPVAPVLAPSHFVALERRLVLVLKTVKDCIDRAGGDATKVIMIEYHNPNVDPEAVEEEDEDHDKPRHDT